MRDVHLRRIAVALCLTLLWSTAASAQHAGGLRAGFPSQPVYGESAGMERSPLPQRDRDARTHWQSGLIAGAVLGAVAANLLLEPGASGGKRIGVTLAGATPFGAIGAMLGSLIPKPTQSTGS